MPVRALQALRRKGEAPGGPDHCLGLQTVHDGVDRQPARPTVVSFLNHTLAVILLTGEDYEPPDSEETDDDMGDDDMTITGKGKSKRTSKSRRKTREPNLRVKEGELIRWELVGSSAGVFAFFKELHEMCPSLHSKSRVQEPRTA